MAPAAPAVRAGRRSPAAWLRLAWTGLGVLGWALVLPLLKRRLSLGTLARLMWRPPRPGPRDAAREAQIVGLVRRVYGPRRLAGRSNCFERSLVLYRFLSGWGAAPQLVLGVRRATGRVPGHAWVLVDGHPLGETGADLAPYVPLVVFGAAGRVTSDQ